LNELPVRKAVKKAVKKAPVKKAVKKAPVEEGREEGAGEEGREEGATYVLLRLLEHRFGELPEAVAAHVQRLSSAQTRGAGSTRCARRRIARAVRHASARVDGGTIEKKKLGFEAFALEGDAVIGAIAQEWSCSRWLRTQDDAFRLGFLHLCHVRPVSSNVLPASEHTDQIVSQLLKEFSHKKSHCA
jgi:hypothetical protein